MQCHTNNEQSCYFSTRSDFKPFAAPIAQTQAEPKKQHKEPPKYLPGERLLIKLGTDRKKEKEKEKKNIDIDKITKSLSRVLSNF
jgi:hypothetical protein